jgi:hypothetical protein
MTTIVIIIIIIIPNLLHIVLLPPPISPRLHYGILKLPHHNQLASCVMKYSAAPDGCTHNTTTLGFVAESQGAKHLLFANGVPNNKSCVFYENCQHTSQFLLENK